jgi:hypothetical protein
MGAPEDSNAGGDSNFQAPTYLRLRWWRVTACQEGDNLTFTYAQVHFYICTV